MRAGAAAHVDTIGDLAASDHTLTTRPARLPVNLPLANTRTVYATPFNHT